MSDLQHLADSVRGVYDSWGYLLVVAGALVENTTPLGLVLPAGTLVMLGGAYAHQGTLSLPIVLAAGWLGALIGLQCDFMLGRWLLPRYLGDTKLMSWLAPRLPGAERFLQHHGRWAYVLAEFSGPMRSIVTISTGMGTMPHRQYLLYSLLPALAFSVFNVVAGNLIGVIVSLFHGLLGDRALLILVIAALALYSSYRLFSLWRMTRRQAKEEPPHMAG